MTDLWAGTRVERAVAVATVKMVVGAGAVAVIAATTVAEESPTPQKPGELLSRKPDTRPTVTYRSHPVRRICTDPHPTESITLVVEVDPDELDREALDSALGDLDGTVEAELPYDSYRLTLSQSAVAEFCETDGLRRVETANVTDLGDAGEDL